MDGIQRNSMKNICIVLVFLVVLAPFLAVIPGTSANSVPSPLSNGLTNVTRVEGFHGSVFLVQHGQNLSTYDINSGIFIDTVSCWSNQSLMLNANRDIVVCRNHVYGIDSQGNFSLRNSGVFPTYNINPNTLHSWTWTKPVPNWCWNNGAGNGRYAWLNINDVSGSTLKNLTIESPWRGNGGNNQHINMRLIYLDDESELVHFFYDYSSSSNQCNIGSIYHQVINSSLNLSSYLLNPQTVVCESPELNEGILVFSTTISSVCTRQAVSLNGTLPPTMTANYLENITLGFNWGLQCSMSFTNPATSTYATITLNDITSTILDEDMTPLNSLSVSNFGDVACNDHHNATYVLNGELRSFWVDSDGDGYNDLVDPFPSVASQYLDGDGDGFGDNVSGYEADACPSQFGTSYQDRFGCTDSDGDGWSDVVDTFPNRASQWNDTDGDGFGDNLTGFRGDSCPGVFGDSFRNNTYGCPDADFDGWTDVQDKFPSQSSQWNDSDGDGYGDEFSGYQGDECPSTPGTSTIDRFGCLDQDSDGYSDLNDAFPSNPSQYIDTDGDGYGNNQSASANQSDAFPSDGTQWSDADGDGHGDNKYGSQGDHFPSDPTRWQDSDEDGYANEDDAFDNDPTQWADADGDGYGDNPNGNNADDFPNNSSEWRDSDGDGVGDNSDEFRFDGSQWKDRDGDGYGDNPNGTNPDAFPDDPTRWDDSDRDGVPDEDDDFENDGSQDSDRDGDGYGDNPNGSNPDAFPDDAGEWRDADGDGYGDNEDDAFPGDGTQWNDTDGDGYGDNREGNNGDHFPNDPNRTRDSDSDGVDDKEDAFPNDPTQQTDRDGDGYGDNASGNNADAFPDDDQEWADADGDGYGDNGMDSLSFNPSQHQDTDGDGFGDNPNGLNPDAFPFDSTQQTDRDNDGYGDNASGNNPDAFPADTTQWFDADGDGYGDNPAGRLPDLFPNNPTQWEDNDGDGLGDNQSGTDADPFLDDFDNDGYPDSEDPLPKLSSPGDMDNDGVPDDEDAFPADFTESKDSDGDGEGDNADVDDDNDGWTDTDEIRQGADPYSSSSQPVEGFEVLIPRTQISLGAWDLIGIFGGVPLFVWVAFGFATRNNRTLRYETMLKRSTSVEQLDEISRQWEYSLMMRMLGPHQGIRLERLRADLEYEMLGQRRTSTMVEQVDQTGLVQKQLPKLNPTSSVSPPVVASDSNTPGKSNGAMWLHPDPTTPAQQQDGNGYEWYMRNDGVKFYRAADSGASWILHQP